MKHTKEPWKVDEKESMFITDLEDSETIAECLCNDSDGTYKLNAERIVACVNACQGITNEALKAGVVEWGVTMADDITNRDIWSGDEKIKIWEVE